MSDNLKDILSNSNKDIDNQQLMDYLSNQLSRSDKHEVEKTMADDSFMNDAIEGLQKLDKPKDIDAYVTQLNKDLQKHLLKNKNIRNKRKWKDQPYVYLTVILILFLLVISFVILKKFLG